MNKKTKKLTKLVLSLLVSVSWFAGCATIDDAGFIKHCYDWQAGLTGCVNHHQGLHKRSDGATVKKETEATYVDRTAELYEELELVAIAFEPYCPVEWWWQGPSLSSEVRPGVASGPWPNTLEHSNKSLEAVLTAKLGYKWHLRFRDAAIMGLDIDELFPQMERDFMKELRQTKYTCMFLREYEGLLLYHWPGRDFIVYPRAYLKKGPVP